MLNKKLIYQIKIVEFNTWIKWKKEKHGAMQTKLNKHVGYSFSFLIKHKNKKTSTFQRFTGDNLFLQNLVSMPKKDKIIEFYTYTNNNNSSSYVFQPRTSILSLFPQQCHFHHDLISSPVQFPIPRVHIALLSSKFLTQNQKQKSP